MKPNYANLPLEFFSFLDKQEKKPLNMGIGLSVVDPEDSEKCSYFDVVLSSYNNTKKELEEYMLKNKSSNFIFNYDFNNFVVINTRILEKFNSSNKLDSIIFDSSTFKFLHNIKFVAILYYITLKTNGSIYIESNNPFSMGFILNSITELYNLTDSSSKHAFKYQYAFILQNSILHNIPLDKMENIKDFLLERDQIYTHNLNYLEKWFYGSKVELLDCDKFPYPINNEKYPIKKYYKITKILEHTDILEHLKINIEDYNKGWDLKGVSIIKQNITN